MEEAKLADDLYQKLVGQYCKKNEKGEIEAHEGRPGTFIIPEEKSAEWKEKLAELEAISFEIDRPKMALDDIQTAAALSPMDIMKLECFLTFEDEAPVLKAVKD